MLAMTWAAGDSQPEKFETARGFYVAVLRRPANGPARPSRDFRRPSVASPCANSRRWPRACGTRSGPRYAERLLVDGFEPMGCDGSRIECPRTAELEARLRPAGKDDSAPTVWVTAFVHLATGLLWSWRLGPGTADERLHLRQLLATLSPAGPDRRRRGLHGLRAGPGHRADAGGRSCCGCRRRSISTPLEERELETWTEGPVYYWPEYVQKKGLPPLACRLIRVPAHGQAKHDVWLLTDILDPARLSAATAAKFYRWRWRNEGVFRIYKRTINKLKLSSRTVRLVHREAEVSLLALQMLLAHADLALRPKRSGGGAGDQPAAGADRDPPRR